MKEHNKYYWDNKNGRAKLAKEHTEEMAKKYKKEIDACVKETKIYTMSSLQKELAEPKLGMLKMRVVEMDSVSGAFESYYGRTAILNFASYKFPGGGFLAGSRAQEECLCHESFLYNVLREFEESYYEKNRGELNRALYKHKALYSPNVVFEHNNEVCSFDVITCASPNFSTAEKFVTREENNKVMRQRIRFVLDIAKKNNVDTLVLGAWGCGVFRQDPEFVAKCFAEECKSVLGDVEMNVVFAVIPPLPNQTDNCTPFKREIEK